MRFAILNIFILLCAVELALPARASAESINPALLPLFGRGLANAFVGRGLLNNLNLQNINFNNFSNNIFPADVAGFSRIKQDPRNKNRFLLANNAGLVDREIVTVGGNIFAAVTDFLGNRRSGFFPLRDADSIAEASKFFLADETLIDPLKVGRNQAFVNLIRKRQLAQSTLGPLANGSVTIDCAGVTGKTIPNGTEAAKANLDAFKTMSDIDVCKKTLLMALNSIKNPFSRTITEKNLKINAGGTIQVTGLLNFFLPEDLALLLNRFDNPRRCNSDPGNANPPVMIDHVVDVAMDKDLYAIFRKVDATDINRNAVLQFGVDLNTPEQLRGRVGVFGSQPPTNRLFIDNPQRSGVAVSTGKRLVEAIVGKRGNGFYITKDTNAAISGKVGNRDQDAATSGLNLGYRQAEYWGLAEDGIPTWILAASPNEKGERKRAAEAPASAAHGPGGDVAVQGQNCIACHTCLGGLVSQQGGPYRDEAFRGTNGIKNFENGPIRNDLARYLAKAKEAGFYVPENGKKAQCLEPLTWRAQMKAKMPRSPEMIDSEMRIPQGTTRNVINSNPSRWNSILALDKDGNIDAARFKAGGYCALRDEIRRFPGVRGSGPSGTASNGGTGGASGNPPTGAQHSAGSGT